MVRPWKSQTKAIRKSPLRFGGGNSRGFFAPRPKQKLFQRWRKRFGRTRSCPTVLGLSQRNVLAQGVRLPEETWTIRVTRRRDAAQTKTRIAVWEQYKEVQKLIYQGKSKTAACREVANRAGKRKTQRAVEIAYNECAELMSRLIEEPKRRAEAAMQRSKALRENLRSGSELEDDPSS